MSSVNKVMLIGNLTRDPELRYTPGGAQVGEFGMAMNRTFKTGDGQTKEEVTFVDITVWGRQAETCNEYLSKGRPVHVEGRLQLDEWETQDGQKRTKLKVVAERVTFLGSGGGGGNGGGSRGGGGRTERGGGGRTEGRPGQQRQQPQRTQGRPGQQQERPNDDMDLDDIPF